MPRFAIILDAPDDIRLRRALKDLLRRHRLRAIDVREQPSASVQEPPQDARSHAQATSGPSDAPKRARIDGRGRSGGPGNGPCAHFRFKVPRRARITSWRIGSDDE